MRNKRVMIVGLAAAAIVLVGILFALLLTPVTTFLLGGSGDDFRNAGTCTARKVAEDASPTPTENSSIVIINTATPEPTETTEQPTANWEQSFSPEPTSTPLPYDKLYSMADTSMMKDIVNILLIGVDFSEERLTWNGKKEWHSDVMMVLSVNFDENRADLISLPRDTYANIPGVDGIYKLNASLNCGGGLYKNDGSVNPAGLEKVCESAEWMLGGIPVDYYYAVTMTSLKSLVDAFGGLDYDLDISFKIQGRSYVKGLQHMDGQAVLDYCRVRKAGNGLSAADVGDANRVNRQKRILVAFFEHMKKNNLIVRIPDVIDAFKGELFTNCTPSQTAALAAFAYNLNREDIGMYSMGGSQASLFQWNFVFTDQANRVDIIQKVYGVAAKQYRQYTLKYGRYRWCSMLYDQYIDLCDPLRKYVQKLIDADDLLPEFTASPEPTEAPTDVPTEAPTIAPTQEPTKAPTDEPTEKPTETPTKAPTPKPTEESTDAPTEAPTRASTLRPTEEPTQQPTEEPTKEPTPKPTEEPTEEPTDTPTPKPETIDIKVEIEWNDQKDKDGVRPKKVPIKLEGDGKTYQETVKENKNGNWVVTFENLPKQNEEGNNIGYAVSIDKSQEDLYRELKQNYSWTKDDITGSASKGFTIKLTHEVKETPTDAPTDAPTNEPSEDEGETADTNTAKGYRVLFEETRKYTQEQRDLFESFKTALDELKSLKKSADSEAKKSASGKSNSLNAVSVSYLSQLETVQNLAIEVAKAFNYTEVKNFTTPFTPRNTGWNTSSPWAVNYGLDRKFNEIRVDFN